MASTRIAVRYAKSILKIAIDMSMVEQVHEDMKLISNVMKENRDFVAMLKSPVIKTNKKQDIITALFSGKISEITMKFMMIIIVKKREGLLQEIAASFVAIYRNYNEIVSAKVTTTTKLNPAQKEQIMSLVNQFQGGTSISLEEILDPNIIGGFILRVGDRQYDNSILNKLQKLKSNFDDNPYVSEL